MSRKWHKGPPPHVGWWEASWNRNAGIWRWWDGYRWSVHVDQHAQAAGALARKKVFVDADEIEWTHYYPKNARVPRIDPRKVK